MSFGNVIRGLAELTKAIDEQTKMHEGALGAALYQEGLAIDAEAVKQMPVDTGRMRATHYVTPPQDDGDGPVVEAGIGVDYGIYVHERLNVNHQVGNAKFYENPLNEARAGYAERIKERTQKNLKAGVTMAPIQAPTSPAKSSVTLDKKTATRTGTTNRKGRK